MPQISIITVNYKTPALVIQLIKSIYETTHGISFEIIVVDNASEDNGKQLITKQFPSVVWIQNDENEGFARGNNKGMQAAKGQYILLINSDVLVKDNTIASCHDFYQKQVNPVILGCKLLNKDLTHQNSVYYSISGFKELLSYNLIISRLLKKQPKNLNDQQEIKALMGAFLFFEKNILKKTGLFDDDFFLYSEEIEWQIRARNSGIKLLYYNEAEVIHLGGESSKNKFSQKQRHLSIALFFLKRYNRTGLVFYLFLQMINLLSNIPFGIIGKVKIKDLFSYYGSIFSPALLIHYYKMFFRFKRNSKKVNYLVKVS